MTDNELFTEIEEARAFAQAIVDTVREPFLVLDNDLRVLAASRSFYQTFKVGHDDTQGRLLYALGDGQWDIPGLRLLLEKIVPERGVMENYEVEHEFPDIGPRTMLLNARKVFYEGGSHTTILLGIEDVTGQRVLEGEKDELLQAAQKANNLADELLHALLPKKAADEIRSTGSVIPRRYENVAVLFCDVTNFTAYCDNHEPEDVVSRLDALFVILERVAAKHGLEKIKTIGDAFMAAAGLLNEVKDPIGSAVRCGLEMASISIDAQLGWEVRVGVHAGAVVAGIVGKERYQFDIWGDTVNVAARMASKCRSGGVAVTMDIWERVSSDFAGEGLGEVKIKGKGTISIFEILGIRLVVAGA